MMTPRVRILSLALVAALLLGVQPLSAQSRFGIGLEWGFGYHPACWHALSYNTGDGYRIDIEGWKGMQHVNGFATLSLEYDLARRHCLSLTGSKRGVGNGDRIYPLQLRWSWYSNGHSDDSPFWYVEDGVGYNRDARVRLALTGGIGAGYRYRLGNHSFVDMAARVSYARYKPDLYDPDTEKRVSVDYIHRNTRLDTFLELQIAIRFR